MKFATVCSGIGAPELAAEALGWDCLFQAEIDPFPRSVLKRHFPEVTCYEDFTGIDPREWVDRIDCMVAGTPCQDFSVAGNRTGIAGNRGNLVLDYVRLVQQTECPWGILENVPGLLTRDLGHVLDAITGRNDLHGYRQWTKAGVVAAGETGYSAAWRVLDSQYFGIPQRRRRLFIAFHLGDWGAPASVLFEPAGRGGDTAAGETARKRHTGEAEPGAHGISGHTINTVDRPAVCVYENHGISARYKPAYMDTGGCNLPLVLDDHGGKRQYVYRDRIGTLRSRSQNIPVVLADEGPVVYSNHTIAARTEEIDAVNTLAGGERNLPIVLGDPLHLPAVELPETYIVLSGAQQNAAVCEDMIPTLTARQYKDKPLLFHDSTPRYLTPLEAERAFGFPDNWTDVPSGATKGKRYKALGNSMAVPVLRWILERLDTYTRLKS